MELFFPRFQHFKYICCHLKGTVDVILNELPHVDSQSGVSNLQQYPLNLCLIKYERRIFVFYRSACFRLLVVINLRKINIHFLKVEKVNIHIYLSIFENRVRQRLSGIFEDYVMSAFVISHCTLACTSIFILKEKHTLCSTLDDQSKSLEYPLNS